MNLPASSYYYKPKAKEVAGKDLIARIEEIVEEFGRYGYRRVTAQLHREGIKINHKRVLRIMQDLGLTCKPMRRWIKTTDSNHGYRIYTKVLSHFKWVIQLCYSPTSL